MKTLGRILARYLKPFRLLFVGVVVFQAQSFAALALPGLNADIIDQGVVTGDVGFILTNGAIMLGLTLVQIACSIAAAVYPAPVPPWDSAGNCVARSSPGSASSANLRRLSDAGLGPEYFTIGSTIRYLQADVNQWRAAHPNGIEIPKRRDLDEVRGIEWCDAGSRRGPAISFLLGTSVGGARKRRFSGPG